MKHKVLFLVLAYFVNVLAILWNSFTVYFWIKFRGGKGMWETLDKSGCLFWLILSVVNLTVITVFLIICKKKGKGGAKNPKTPEKTIARGVKR